MNTVSTPTLGTTVDFSLVRGDLLFRLQRSIGLIPADGLGLVRRALFWSLLGWLPVALWALYIDRALPGGFPEPLLAHYGIHARLLVAVPLLILAEGPANALVERMLRHLVESGIVPVAQRAWFDAAVRQRRAHARRHLALGGDRGQRDRDRHDLRGGRSIRTRSTGRSPGPAGQGAGLRRALVPVRGPLDLLHAGVRVALAHRAGGGPDVARGATRALARARRTPIARQGWASWSDCPESSRRSRSRSAASSRRAGRTTPSTTGCRCRR